MNHYDNNGGGEDYKIPLILLEEDGEDLEEKIEKFWFEERDRKPKEYTC